MAFVKKRTQHKVGVNWSVDARVVVKLEDLAISRKAKISLIVQEVLERGIYSYEVDETKRIVGDLKRDEAMIAQRLNAKPVVKE